ncbi:MAG: Rieske 2Fe-2S domain-containing protein [Chloroflexi bacterium]|nr:Rieske 2Fe-2S domain-containing protein [Chloroflexota bacterium]
MAIETRRLARAATLTEVEVAGCHPVVVEGHTLLLVAAGGRVYAVDNRCPHMGFPLHRGSVADGILTCHWHHARFDLASGGTFDQWADDVRAFPVEVRDGEVWVDLTPLDDPLARHRRRLRDGLERDLSLVIAKQAIPLVEAGEAATCFRIGLEFGTRYRRAGWGQGLTMLTCFMNLLPRLAAEDRPRALYHGLAAVARDSAGAPVRFTVQPLPTTTTDIRTLRRWFRRFVEVRDAEGAERCVVSALQAGADDRQMAAMLFSAATDHRYLTVGHVLDFTNKAFEALDHAGWELAETALTSLVPAYAGATRMEESNAWRHPVDLVAIVEGAAAEVPAALTAGRARSGAWDGRAALTTVLLEDEPRATAAALLAALRAGCGAIDLAGCVVHAAALRLARFHTSNEFGDWDTALHTFTFAAAVEAGLRRMIGLADDDGPADLLRGVFDAAMSVYLDRFLNVPPARLPAPEPRAGAAVAALVALPDLLDQAQQVDAAGALAAAVFADPAAGVASDDLPALLGRLLLREDRDFHTIQTVEAALGQFARRGAGQDGVHHMIAAARYLAAHAPTLRAQGQTYAMAQRLARGELVFEAEN